MNKKSSISILFLLFLGMYCLMAINAKDLSSSNYDNPTINPYPSGIYSPFSINGDSQLASFPDKTGFGNSSHPYVIRDLIIDAGYSGSGIQIIGTTKNLIIINCTVMNSGFNLGDAGIYLKDVYNVSIQFCNASNNGRDGIYCNNANQINITGCILNDNGDDGIKLTSSSDFNYLINNTANNNPNNGIRLNYSNRNYIFNNTLMSNWDKGIQLYQSCSGNYISNNRIRENDVDGIVVYSNSNFNFIIANSLHSNVKGIRIGDNSLYNIISYNNLTNEGIILEGGSDDNSICKNQINSAQNGIYIESCSNITIANNSLVKNSIGIYLYTSSESIIQNNTIANSSKSGIEVKYSSNSNNITFNLIENSTDYGIYLFNSFLNRIHNNTVKYFSSSETIQVSGGGSNVIIDNSYILLDLIPPPPPELSEILPNPSLNGSVYVQWSEVTGAALYKLYRYSGFIVEINESVNCVNITSNEFVFNLNLPNGTYYYVVIASNSSGDSLISNCVNVTVAIPPKIPDAPVLYNIYPNPSDNGSILIEWSESIGVTLYKLYRHTSFITEINDTVLLVNSTSDNFAINPGLLNGTYYYIVIAWNNSGDSEISNCVNVTVAIPPNIEEKYTSEIDGVPVGFICLVSAISYAIIIRKIRSQRNKCA